MLISIYHMQFFLFSYLIQYIPNLLHLQRLKKEIYSKKYWITK